MYQLPTAPLSIGGILDDGFRLFRATWRQLLPIALVAALLGALPEVLIAGLKEIKPGETPGAPTLGIAVVATALVVGFLSILAYSVMLAGVDKAARSGTTSMREALSVGFRRAPAVLGASVVAGLAVGVGLVLLVVPGLYLMVALFPTYVLPVAERLGPLQSFRRARALVKGSWWKTAGILTVVAIILVALFAIVSIVGGLALLPYVGKDNPEAAANTVLVIDVIGALITAPFLPLMYCIFYSVYTDLRLRKDGGDLLRRAAESKG